MVTVSGLLASSSKIDAAAPNFIRAYATGYAFDVVPSILKLLFSLMSGKKNILWQIFTTLRKGFAVSGMALAGGISIGGAKWGEAKIEPLIRKIYFAIQARTKEGKKLEAAKRAGEKVDYEKEKIKAAETENTIRALSTFTASTLASLISVTLLQSEFVKLRHTKTRTDLLPFDRPQKSIPTPSIAKQSPTLDLSLFLLVRALDSIVRGTYEATAPEKPGKLGGAMKFLAGQGDAIVFAFSCWRIMWCWHFQREGLPPGYVAWISKMITLDKSTFTISNLARSGEYVYGQEPSAKVAALCAGMGEFINQPLLNANPHHIHSLNCAFYHGDSMTNSCSLNFIMRYIGIFRKAFKMYGPVHILPVLIFNSRRFISQPIPTIFRILTGTMRSSAFLAAFGSAVPAMTCLFRNFIGPNFLPFITPQTWDSGLCALIGSAACGMSIMVETQRRRKELALYVAPRAIYSVLQECFPNGLAKGRRGVLLSRWLERSIFALATGVATTVTIFRPDLQSGMLRGIIELCIGDWNGTQKKLKAL